MRFIPKQKTLPELLGRPVDAQAWAIWDTYPAQLQLDLTMLRQRFAADGRVQATLQTIGDAHGVTRERVRMRIQRAIQWGRKQAAKE